MKRITLQKDTDCYSCGESIPKGYEAIEHEGDLFCDDCLEDSEYFHEGHEKGGCYQCKMD